MGTRMMRRFWDARADENPFYFIDNRLRYGDLDLDRFWSGGPADLDTVLDTLGVRIEPDHEVIEIGCGVGRITRPLAERAGHVHAFDVSERMIELAEEYNAGLGNVTWIVSDGTTLAPLSDRTADACFSQYVFQHIPDPAITLGYIREMGRVLRPGGWSAFQLSNAPGLHRRRGLRDRTRWTLRSALGRGPGGQSHAAWRGTPVEIAALRSTAEVSGLSIEKLVGEGTPFCCVLLRRAQDQAR